MDSGYEDLRKKYDLAPYEEMNQQYEIGLMEDDEFLSRNIRKKIVEKIEYLVNTFVNIIQPETEFSGMHEANVFTEQDKNDLVELYRALMYLYRGGSRLIVQDSEKDNAAFIKEAHAELKKLQPQMDKFFTKLQDSWKSLHMKADKAGYFG